ncbi:MAG: hypothetical protein NUV80_06445 [Candidatus Berkelbacteria bacterium]|nr:hypothetical protein [Candidatus Berkelbacteria bacterium]
MTKEDFAAWKSDSTTKEVFEVIKHEIAILEYNTAREAGQDAYRDAFKSGMIRGMEKILDVNFEEASVDDN